MQRAISSTVTVTLNATTRGDNAAWSIRNGHTYSDRSALRFDARNRENQSSSFTRLWTRIMPANHP
jgi:hypothetical protein